MSLRNWHLNLVLRRRKFLDVTREPLDRKKGSKEDVKNESRRIKEIGDKATEEVNTAEEVFSEKLKNAVRKVLDCNDARAT